jgi:hypothetical protein
VEHDEAIQARIRATIKIHPENGIDPGGERFSLI